MLAAAACLATPGLAAEPMLTHVTACISACSALLELTCTAQNDVQAAAAQEDATPQQWQLHSDSHRWRDEMHGYIYGIRGQK